MELFMSSSNCFMDTKSRTDGSVGFENADGLMGSSEGVALCIGRFRESAPQKAEGVLHEEAISM